MSADLLVPDVEVPVLDQSRLLEEFGDSPEILNELRDLFLQSLPPLLADIKAAHCAGNRASLARSAHSLKGAGSTYGALRVFEVCRQLESQAKQDQLAEVGPTIELLEVELDKLTEAVASLASSA